MGSPVYFWGVSGEMKSFLERLMFPFYIYKKDDDPVRSLFTKRLPTGFIYTMNSTPVRMEAVGYDKQIAVTEMFLKRIFGSAESLVCYDTVQFDDYSKIYQERFDPEAKAARRKEQFPRDCQDAFDMGVRLATAGRT